MVGPGIVAALRTRPFRRSPLTTIEQVESTLATLVGRLASVDPGLRAMLPARRTVQAECTDLRLMYHAVWQDGQLGRVNEGPADRADIRIRVSSADLAQLAEGTLGFREAYATQRIRIDASMTDLLRLRAVL